MREIHKNKTKEHDLHLKESCTRCGKIKDHRPEADENLPGSCICNETSGPEDVAPIRTESIPVPDLGDQFRVLELIGCGGMGNVFKVVEVATGTILAAKVLNEELSSDKAAIKRFEQEVDAISSLDHPNMIAIHSHGTTDTGAPYMVTEFVEGNTLTNYIRDRKGSETESLRIFIDLCEALSAAHEKGILHRDLKPSNVLLARRDGQVMPKLADFGIARIMPSASSESRETHDLTRTGDIFGTPLYMSPEQCLGFKLDERSDIYSLGCMMYEVMTGAPPFSGDNSIQVVISHINETPISWSGQGKQYPDLEKVIAKCLEKEKDERYQSTRELLHDLIQLRDGERVSVKSSFKEAPPEHSRKDIFHDSMKICGLLLYILMVSFGLTYISFACVFFLLSAVLFHIRKFGRLGLRQETSKKWEKVCSYSLIAWAGLGTLQALCDRGVFEWLPQELQPLTSVVYILHILSTYFALVTSLGLFFHRNDKKRTYREIVRWTALRMIPCVALLIYLLPSTLQMSLYFQQQIGNNDGLTRLRLHAPNAMLARLQLTQMLKPNKSVIEDSSRLLTGEHSSTAIALINRAIDAEVGDLRELYVMRALAFNEMGNLKEAMQDFEKANSLNRKGKQSGGSDRASLIQQAMGDVYLSNKQYDSAIKQYTASAENPYSDHRLAILESRAIARYRNNDFEGAIEDLSKKSESRWSYLSDTAIASLLQRAFLYELAGKSELARADYEKIQNELKQTEPKLEASDELKETLLAHFTATPDYNNYLVRAYVYTKLGDKEKAAKFLTLAELRGDKKDDLIYDFCSRLGKKLTW